MDKESIYELQKIDCNCSDCFFMIRNLKKREESVQLHVEWYTEEFERNKQKLKDLIKWHEENGSAPEVLHQFNWELKKMKFMPDKKEAAIHYGKCSKFDKEVSFMPNTCSVETQQCFKHRKDL